MWLEGKPKLHIVGKHTHFQNSVVVKGKYTRDMWNAFAEEWCSVFILYLNRMRVDQESGILSKAWEAMSSAQHIELQACGVQSHNFFGVGEQCDHP